MNTAKIIILTVQLHVERTNFDVHVNLLWLLFPGKVKVKFAIRQIDN